MFDFKRSLSYVSACSESDVKYAVDVQNIVFGYKQNLKVINKLTLKLVEGINFFLILNILFRFSINIQFFSKYSVIDKYTRY